MTKSPSWIKLRNLKSRAMVGQASVPAWPRRQARPRHQVSNFLTASDAKRRLAATLLVAARWSLLVVATQSPCRGAGADDRRPTTYEPARNKIFFLMGQSNMVGHAPLPNRPGPTSDRLILFGNDYRWHCTGALFCQVIENPVEPIDSPVGQLDAVSIDDGRHRGVIPAGSGPSQALGMRWLGTHPEDNVVLVPCATDSAPLSQWLPGRDRLDRSTLYGSCNYRRTQVLSNGSPQCVVFDQGEADAIEGDAPLWGERFTLFAEAVRTDFGPDIPIVLRKLSDTQTRFDSAWIERVAAEQVVASQRLYRVGLITCDRREGCATLYGAHFTRASYGLIGVRMADTCQALLGTPPRAGVAASPTGMPTVKPSATPPAK